MNQRISLKTDASYKPGEGIGIGYKAKYNGKIVTGRGFSEKECTSTEAEMLATAWSIHNFSEKADIDDLSQWTIVVSTDCQNTVTKFDDGYKSREMRIINHYKDIYNAMLMFWIPRNCNEKADSIAKCMLEKGINND